MKVNHKLRRKGEPFTHCGKALHYSGGIGVISWKDTTCKHCLKHKE